ncbi:MAG: hypothetical protein AAGJ10_12005 [Bacteroidota bacterium]
MRTQVMGIDPGDTTGLALYSPEAHVLVEVTSGTFWAMAERVRREWTQGRLALVVIEDTRALPIYERHNNKKLDRPRRDRLCRNVGRIDRDCALWAALCEETGIPYRLVKPIKGGKWSADTLRGVTGFSGRTNQHGRDAARLVWGVKPRLDEKPLLSEEA